MFDLDDTVYPEWDYLISGITHLIKLLDVEAIDPFTLARNKSSWMEDLVKICGNKVDLKFVQEVYRCHSPNINLRHNMDLLISDLTPIGDLYFITDGDHIRQIKKASRLGLLGYPILTGKSFREESKLHGNRFKFLNEQDYTSFVYVADNPRKDFFWPNKLGWVSVQLRGLDSPIHSYEDETLPDNFMPQQICNTVEELRELLLRIYVA